MKITIEEIVKTTRDVDIIFPCYFEDKCMWIRVDNEHREGVAVFNYGYNRLQIETCKIPEAWLVLQQITKEQFDAKFNEVMNLLIEKLNGSK